MTPEQEEELLREVRTLSERIEGLRRLHVSRARWPRVFARDLAINPDAQYRVHLIGVMYWLINLPVMTWLFFAHMADIWLQWGLYITLMYSIYANLATDYGAMSAAIAAMNGKVRPGRKKSDPGLKSDDDHG